MKNEFTLNNGITLPAAAFGTYKTIDQIAETITEAIKAGYRYFDTASFYGNEEYVGKAIKESGIPRNEFEIATKLWKTEMGYDKTMYAFESSLKRLDTDYIDLYLIHWPLPEPGYKDWKLLDFDTWQTLEKLYNEGVIKAIGVSNFLPHHLKNLLDGCEVKPAVNQIEFHPGYSQEATLNYCKENEILVQAWSPLGRTRVLNDELICELAEKYGKSPAQICIKYALQRGVMPIVKTCNKERMAENLDIHSFEIEEEDMMRLMTMPPTGWSGEHPDRKRVQIQA
mgnify:FL=1